MFQTKRRITLERYGAVDPPIIGEHIPTYGEEFNWYLCDNGIGLQHRSTYESETFMSGLTYDRDTLIIYPEEPMIVRQSQPQYPISGRDPRNQDGIEMLIELLQGQPVTHLYPLLHPNHSKTRLPRILMFSPTPPGEEYDRSDPMPGEFRYELRGLPP